MRQRLLGPRGNETELLHQQLPRSGRQRALINEDENVRQDQQDIDDREGAARRLATKRYHSGFTFYFKNAFGRPRARKPPVPSTFPLLPALTPVLAPYPSLR